MIHNSSEVYLLVRTFSGLYFHIPCLDVMVLCVSIIAYETKLFVSMSPFFPELSILFSQCLLAPLEIMNVFQTWDYTNNLHFVPLRLGVWVILNLVSFLMFWRTLTPLNVKVWLLDWYYLVPWLRWPDGSAETAVFWSPAWGAGLSVGFCWLSQKPLARAECVFVPGTVCKRQAVLNMLL